MITAQNSNIRVTFETKEEIMDRMPSGGNKMFDLYPSYCFHATNPTTNYHETFYISLQVFGKLPFDAKSVIDTGLLNNLGRMLQEKAGVDVSVKPGFVNRYLENGFEVRSRGKDASKSPTPRDGTLEDVLREVLGTAILVHSGIVAIRNSNKIKTAIHNRNVAPKRGMGDYGMDVVLRGGMLFQTASNVVEKATAGYYKVSINNHVMTGVIHNQVSGEHCFVPTTYFNPVFLAEELKQRIVAYFKPLFGFPDTAVNVVYCPPLPVVEAVIGNAVVKEAFVAAQNKKHNRKKTVTA